jgi:hypothetical protein
MEFFNRIGQLRSIASTTWISAKRTYGSDANVSERSAPAQSGNFSARSIAWKRGSLRNGSKKKFTFV